MLTSPCQAGWVSALVTTLQYLEAVAAALASQMGAGLLAVDAMLLASLASSMFAAPPEAYLAAFSGTGGGSGGGGKAAKKLALAWLALREGLFSLERPTGRWRVRRRRRSACQQNSPPCLQRCG